MLGVHILIPVISGFFFKDIWCNKLIKVYNTLKNNVKIACISDTITAVEN
jgi:hypothetical protein